MNATSLEFPDHAPEPETLAEGNFCPIKAAMQVGFEGMDDMAFFEEQVPA